MSVPVPSRTTPEVVEALSRELDSVRFPFPAPALEEAAARRDELSGLIASQGARAVAAGAPDVVAVVGATGVGKSVLANGLAGAPVSEVGAIRPTTSQAMLLAHPETVALLGCHPVLREARVVTDPRLRRDVAVLDCADPFAVGNDPSRAQPEAPVSAYVVVASALRYGDAALWDLLRWVGCAGVPVGLVVSRVPEGAWEEIRPQIVSRLEALTLGYVEVFAVPWVAAAPQALRGDVVARLRQWLLASRGQAPADRQDAWTSLLAALPQLAELTAALVLDQRVHAQAGALLGAATAQWVKDQTVRARGLPVGPPPSALTDSWLGLIAPDGPLADVAAGGDVPADRRERWAGALDRLGQSVDDAVERDAAAQARAAGLGLAALWQGPDVPGGSRELAARAGLATLWQGPSAPGLSWDPSVHWRQALRAGLAADPAPGRAAEALTTAGLESVVMAAALGAPGPRELLAQFTGEQAGHVAELGRAALAATRAGAVQAAAAPFLAAVAECEVPVSGVLAWAAAQLAAVASAAEGPVAAAGGGDL